MITCLVKFDDLKFMFYLHSANITLEHDVLKVLIDLYSINCIIKQIRMFCFRSNLYSTRIRYTHSF